MGRSGLLGRSDHRSGCRSSTGVACASPRGFGAEAPKRTVSRVLFRVPVAPHAAAIIHLDGALLRRSSTQPGHWRRRATRRAGRPRQCPYSSLLREGLAPPPVTRLSRVGSYPTISTLPVPPCRAPLNAPADHRPSAVWFLLRFPSGCPGSPLATSLPCGARTFLPRACGPPAITRPPPASSSYPLRAHRANPRGPPKLVLVRLEARELSLRNVLTYWLNLKSVFVRY